MSRCSFLIASIFVSLIGSKVFANDQIFGDYVVINNDCMKSIAVGSVLSIQQTESSVAITGPDLNFQYSIGHNEYGEADDFITSNGRLTSDSFYFEQTEDTSAGTSRSYSVVSILKATAGVQLRIANNVSFFPLNLKACLLENH